MSPRILLLAMALLAGCATQPTPQRLAVSCSAALDLPDEPARTLETDPKQPGATVRAVHINRAAWIAHADELTQRLRACQ